MVARFEVRRPIVLAVAIVTTIAGSTVVGAPVQAQDPEPTISINDPAAVVEDAGSLSFVVSLSAESAFRVRVDYATADGTAVAGSDYLAAEHTLLIPPGSTAGTIEVLLLDDGTAEPGLGETFTVTLSNPVNAVIDDPSGTVTATGTIVDNETAQVVIGDGSVAEWDAGSDEEMVFEVSLTIPSTSTVAVEYATADGSATAGADYVATSGTVVFPPLSTGPQEIRVTVKGDSIDDDGETLVVNLSGATGGAEIAGGTGTGTIREKLAQFGVRDTEGNLRLRFDAGKRVAFFGEITDAGPERTHTLTVDWGDGSTPDVTTLAPGVLSFEANHVYPSDLGGGISTTYFAEVTISTSTNNLGVLEATRRGPVVIFNTLSPAQVGLVDPSQGQWHLRGDNGTVRSFFYGNPGDFPIVGDWECGGIATPGLFRQSDGFAYLRNSNNPGIADIRFFFGNPSDIPLAGDWDGDGCDTLSVYRPSTQEFFIVNKLGENEGGLGSADFSFIFGDPGDKPVVGDWDGDGIDEVGLHRESTGFFYSRNTLTQGVADGEIFFGDPGDRFVAGDWGIVDGVDTPAVFRPAGTTFFFRHTLTQGVADSQFVFGESGWLPVAGKFGLG